MNTAWWNRAKDFHGHECPGLAIGFRACEAVAEKLGVGPAVDEELLCITENDACGVDAIQALLGCTYGKGNLLRKDTGKPAYTVIARSDGRALRCYFKARNSGMDRDAWREYLLHAPVDDLFDCRRVDVPIPERARIFASETCELCGESAPEHKMRLQEGKKVCLDCFQDYTREW